MDYTGILNEKENQIVELEKKIQNLEERLRRASKRETELEEEIVRINGAFRKVQNPNITKAEIESILIGSVQIRGVE
jgi:chromosome segregation ATPase